MTDRNCAYCMEGELVAAFGIKICELPASKVYLFKEQSHKGRVIVAHKKHVSEIVELTAEERAAYMEDINHVAEAIHKAFHPQKVNYGAYGDTGHHLHFHLVPKYQNEYEYNECSYRVHPHSVSRLNSFLNFIPINSKRQANHRLPFVINCL